MRGQNSSWASPTHPSELKVIHWAGRMPGNVRTSSWWDGSVDGDSSADPGGWRRNVLWPADVLRTKCGLAAHHHRDLKPRTTADSGHQTIAFHLTPAHEFEPRAVRVVSSIRYLSNDDDRNKDNGDDDDNRFEQRQTHANKTEELSWCYYFSWGIRPKR